MAKFIVKGNVKYNGENYTNGSVIEVKKEHIEEFKKYGWEIVDEKPQVNEPENGEGNEPNGDENGEGEAQEGEGEPQPIDYSKLTNEQLRDLLDQKEIKYAMNYNKAQLIALLEG